MGEKPAKSLFLERRIMRFVDDDRRRNKDRQRRHQLDQARVEPLAGHVAPAGVIASPRARGVFGPLRRHEGGEERSFAARLREARHRWQHAFEPGDMPVGPFDEERLDVHAQVDGPGAGQSEPEVG